MKNLFFKTWLGKEERFCVSLIKGVPVAEGMREWGGEEEACSEYSYSLCQSSEDGMCC